MNNIAYVVTNVCDSVCISGKEGGGDVHCTLLSLRYLHPLEQSGQGVVKPNMQVAIADTDSGPHLSYLPHL